jgi:hypothetical protein
LTIYGAAIDDKSGNLLLTLDSPQLVVYDLWCFDCSGGAASFKASSLRQLHGENCDVYRQSIADERNPIYDIDTPASLLFRETSRLAIFMGICGGERKFIRLNHKIFQQIVFRVPFDLNFS